MVMVRSSVASSVSTKSMSFWPMPSRSAQRSMEATASAAVTGAPSWKVSPSRSVMV